MWYVYWYYKATILEIEIHCQEIYSISGEFEQWFRQI